ncbi:MAG: DUF3883 domain-containing protein [Candidatus Cloacimonadota bacterium]|nr:DUF3883 domain-containing protein [Candidatus Cloacimonadota bacterium]
MNNETCIHGGVAPVSLLKNLHDSQAGSGRHKCPTCAYEQGFLLGSSKKWSTYAEYCKVLIDKEECQIGSIAPTSILKKLGINQGGSGRHKCTNCAFKEGFEVGILENKIEDIKFKIVPAPKSKVSKFSRKFSAVKDVDFIKLEIENKRLGLLGELFVIQIERKHLIKNNRKDLADLIEHTSKEIGDGLGYDILSYTTNGEKKHIEVKTTRGEINRPFYLTKNEIEFSQQESNSYYLYRIFDFNTGLNVGKLYKVKGNINDTLELEPILYLAIPK